MVFTSTNGCVCSSGDGNRWADSVNVVIIMAIQIVVSASLILLNIIVVM